MPAKVNTRYTRAPLWLLTEEISDRAKVAYLHLYSYQTLSEARGKQGAFPSHKKLSELLSCSVSSARRALSELEDVGAIYPEPRTDGKGRQLSNRYLVIFDEAQRDTLRVSDQLYSPLTGAMLTDEHPEEVTAEQGDLFTGEQRIRLTGTQTEKEQDKAPAGPVAWDLIELWDSVAPGFQPGNMAGPYKGKQLGIAKRLLEKWALEEIEKTMRALEAQAWRSDPWDLGTVESQIGRMAAHDWKQNGKRPGLEPDGRRRQHETLTSRYSSEHPSGDGTG